MIGEDYMEIVRKFTKYVSLNIFAMIGMSCYILADSYFISVAEGANGLATLNLVLPVYNFIFAMGSMIGLGSATRFTIDRARGKEKAGTYFSNAVMWVLVFGMIFMAVGGIFPEKVVKLMGGDGELIAIGTVYTRIFMLFAPAFMLNFIWGAFVRNDGAPTLAMVATLTSSFSNILLDYLFMFPLKMGMAGAALATGISPLISIGICSLHFIGKENQITFQFHKPSGRKLIESCKLGVSGFVGEMSTGVTTIVFNVIMLRLLGNVGVAAYGVIANFSLVAISIFNGLAQGSQPLISHYYGGNKHKAVRRILKMALITELVISFLVLGSVYMFTDFFVSLFNSEHSMRLAEYAYEGLRMYFLGLPFAGFNIVGIGYLGAVERARPAMAAAILRGLVAIVGFALLLSVCFGARGAWLAFLAAEFVTGMVTLFNLQGVGGRQCSDIVD